MPEPPRCQPGWGTPPWCDHTGPHHTASACQCFRQERRPSRLGGLDAHLQAAREQSVPLSPAQKFTLTLSPEKRGESLRFNLKIFCFFFCRFLLRKESHPVSCVRKQKGAGAQGVPGQAPTLLVPVARVVCPAACHLPHHRVLFPSTWMEEKACDS